IAIYESTDRTHPQWLLEAHVRLADNWTALNAAYDTPDPMNDAQKSYERALELSNQCPKLSPTDRAVIMLKLANNCIRIYLFQHQPKFLDKAEQNYNEARSTFMHHPGSHELSFGQTLCGLGHVAQLRGQLKKAEGLLRTGINHITKSAGLDTSAL